MKERIVIEQVKNGVNAMKLPVRDLESNWTYMVMATLAWEHKGMIWDIDAQSDTGGRKYRRWSFAGFCIRWFCCHAR